MKVFINKNSIKDYFNDNVSELEILNTNYALKIPKNIKNLTIFLSAINKESIQESLIKKLNLTSLEMISDLSFVPSSVNELFITFGNSVNINTLKLNKIDTLILEGKILNKQDHQLIHKNKFKRLHVKEFDFNYWNNNIKNIKVNNAINITSNIDKLLSFCNNISIKTNEIVYINNLDDWITNNILEDDFRFNLIAKKVYINPKDKEVFLKINNILKIKNYDFLEKNSLMESIY